MKKLTAFVLTIVLLFALCAPAMAARDTAFEKTLAGELKQLGLFQGVSDTDFALDRAPTRLEALVMLVRALGKEAEAKSGSWKHPFTDVPTWGDPYVGYCYQNKLTNGISDTKFGMSDAGAAMYLTFMLRALGYSDGAGGDFTWDAPYTLAKQIGILPDQVNTGTFWRADVVSITYAALNAKLKSGTTTLAQKLIAAGVFTQEAFNRIYRADAFVQTLAPDDERTELTSEQIYARCMPAVFYIEVYDEYGDAIASGSGFFIDGSGTAVTNHHVIYGATSAKVTLSDSSGRDLGTRDVLGVYDWDEAEDWAVLKVDGSNDSWLKVGDPSTVTGGAQVYALGSPLGLTASLSPGMISNPARVVDGQTYIQFSAPISHGSSGGALVNKYGEVIGITAAAFDEGQNLNLAVPITKIADAEHGALTPINETYKIPQGIVYPDSSYLTVKTGEQGSVYINTLKYDTDEYLHMDYYYMDENGNSLSSDECIISLDFGDWYTENNGFMLYVNSKGPCGTVIIRMELSTLDSRQLLDYDFLYVTVVGGEIGTDAESDVITIDEGASVTLDVISHVFKSGIRKTIRPEIEDKTIVSCSWGKWDDTNTHIPLTIRGLACGTTGLTLKLMDNDTNEVLATAYLSITVVGGKLTISTPELMLAPGETATVLITGTPNDPNVHATLYADEYDSYVIDWQRGALGESPVQLKITALEEGWDCIYITLETDDGTILVDGWIDVYVNSDGRGDDESVHLVNGAMELAIGQSIYADLNGDGEEELLRLWLVGDDNGGSLVRLSINGVDYSDALYALAERFDDPDDSFWAITDIDETDGLLEIAIQDWGPSDDLTTTFFRFDGSRLSCLDAVEGFLFQTEGAGSVSILGGGKVGSQMRLRVLQTWWAPVEYSLGTNGKLAVIPQTFYTSTVKDQQTTLRHDVYVYDSPDTKLPAHILSAGTTAQIVGTDNAQWVMLRLADGSEAWLQLVGYGFELETPEGLLYAWDVLSGLLMAD